MPPEVEHLEANIYGFDSLFRLVSLKFRVIFGGKYLPT